MPHEPWVELDDGSPYAAVEETPFGLYLNLWGEVGSTVGRQRQVLQTQSADRMLGELFARLPGRHLRRRADRGGRRPRPGPVAGGAAAGPGAVAVRATGVDPDDRQDAAPGRGRDRRPQTCGASTWCPRSPTSGRRPALGGRRRPRRPGRPASRPGRQAGHRQLGQRDGTGPGSDFVPIGAAAGFARAGERLRPRRRRPRGVAPRASTASWWGGTSAACRWPMARRARWR